MLNTKFCIQGERIDMKWSLYNRKDISVFMAEEAQQWVDSIELHQQVVEVRHGGDHVHLLDDVVQIQLSLHEPGLRSETYWLAF